LPRFLKYSLKVLGVFTGILILIFLVLFVYISLNKGAIIKKVTEEIGKKINGKVSIGDVELSFIRTFPNASVLLHNVSITDTMYEKHHHLFFKGQDVYVELGIIKLIKNESAIRGFRIDKASIYLYTSENGYTNAYLLKPRNDSASAGVKPGNVENELRSIVLDDVRVTIDDLKEKKLYDVAANDLAIKIKDNEDATLFSVRANILINGLAFYIPNGSFLREKKFQGDFDFRIEKKSEQLRFDSIDIKLAGQPFNFSGSFDLIGPQPQFNLRLHTRNIMYDDAKSLLAAKTDTALSIVDLDKKLDADANISGPLHEGDPLILVTWKAKNTNFTTPFINFNDASFTGYYTNEVIAGLPRRDPNSKIEISNLSATWNGLPISSDKIDILNLEKPILTCDLTSTFPLSRLNSIMGSNSLQLESGNGSINLTFNGPLEKNINANSFINGVVSFKNGNILYVPKNLAFKNVNGSLLFRNSDLVIENIECEVLDNKLIMNGQVKNLLSLMTTEPNKAHIDWNIYSPSLNLSAFRYLLKTGIKNAPNTTYQHKLNKVASGIDNVLEKGSLNVSLKTPSLVYKKFEANDVMANISISQNTYIINNIRMQQAGGQINLNGSLLTSKENYHETSIHGTLDNVDVKRVFEAFGNFGQDGIEAQNLEGKLDATVNASLAINNEGDTYPGSLKGTVDFSLKNGSLINYEPLEKIKPFLFTDRDFNNIKFAELKDHLDIANQEIKISRMEIESNVISMFVEGAYSMKGNTDITLQIPLSNLKKRASDYKPENLGIDKKAGVSIFLRGQPGPDGKIRFKPEIFDKLKKMKNQILNSIFK
jgi:hypothetical protein